MSENNTKMKDIYIPLASIGIALLIMLIDVVFLSKEAYNNLVQGILIIIVGKIILFIVVMLLGLGLCSWFGFPFDPFWVALLQLVAVALITSAIGTLGPLIGAIASYLNIAIFLGLMGYFFGDDAINALIAIFLLFAGYLVVTSVLLPLVKMLV